MDVLNGESSARERTIKTGCQRIARKLVANARVSFLRYYCNIQFNKWKEKFEASRSIIFILVGQ